MQSHRETIYSFRKVEIKRPALLVPTKIDHVHDPLHHLEFISLGERVQCRLLTPS